MSKLNYCLFCNKENLRFWFTKISNLDSLKYNIYKCIDCKGSFVWPTPRDDYLNNFYNSKKNSHGGDVTNQDLKNYFNNILICEDLYPNSSIDAERIIKNSKKFSLGKKFLDIGAGYGFFTKEAINNGFNCTAIELSLVNCEIFKLMNGFEPLNISFDENFANMNFSKFDVVLLSQVLEHIPDPHLVIQRIYTVLKPGGICVIAVPHFGSFISIFQGKNDMFITPPEHLNFFSFNGLQQAFKINGFTLLIAHTISRYDKNKLRKYFKNKFLLKFSYLFILTILVISDIFKRGMFINAYFKKN